MITAASAVKSKNVIVTGGASGIGLAIVQTLAALSARSIAIFDVSITAAEQVVAELGKEFPETRFLLEKCDISSWQQQKSAFESIFQTVGSIDLVFANAGVSEFGKFLEQEVGEPSEPNLKTLDINLVGSLYSVRLAVHYMRKNTSKRKGSIICTGSNAGIYPFPVAPMYGISKHAIVGAVRSLAAPLDVEGIQINGICPNCIRTGLAPDGLLENMQITPMSTLIAAVVNLVENPGLTGQIAEISGDHFKLREPPDFLDSITKTNLDMFSALGYA
ncbi:putative short chain dehydrogenase/reductase [Tricladium varicosporioides]|nr:putative short chain dehydrogenase/reductase [Hymenoscyphus varicosporioides]